MTGTRIRGAAPLLVAVVMVVTSSPARAQITSEPVSPYPDPRKFARGLFGEGEAGTVVFVGNAASAVGPGVAVGGRLGYEAFRWLALQIHAIGSTHTTKLADSPQAGQLLQLYQGTAELRLTIPFGRVGLSVVGGAGLARLSTNVLGTAGFTDPDVKRTFVYTGGASVDYHTLSRHFSFGLGAAFAKYPSVYTTGAVNAGAYVRYTF